MNQRWMASSPAGTWIKPPAPRPGRGRAGLVVGTEPRQAWEGFGGCFNELGWVALAALSSRDRAAALRALFAERDGCGFTRCRLPIGASDYAAAWYSHNEHDGDYAMRRFSIARDEQYLIPYIRSAQAIQPALSLFASPWSPPTWMKFPPAYNYGTLVWSPRNLRAYAQYVVKFVQAYAKAGIRIDQVHPQNEPVADQKFPSCKWTGAQLRDFIRDYLGPALRRSGLPTEIWLGTLNTADYNGFVHAVLSDPRANRYIAGVGFQWDGKGAIQRTHQAWPDKRLMQTENECGDGQNTWDYAHYVFELLHHYITNGANAYVYWNMVLPAGGRSTWGWLQNAMLSVDLERGRLAYNPEFFVMKHFAHFVKPGGTVLGVAGPWSGNAVAFRNPDGRRVCVIQNPSSEPQGLNVDVGGGLVALSLLPRSIQTLVVG
ncbi:MAG: glycosyl hydrolase [Lentisphaerae bacterium]|nr:glycosyl hydrolase [Lentisphaerota bacterium]